MTTPETTPDQIDELLPILSRVRDSAVSRESKGAVRRALLILLEYRDRIHAEGDLHPTETETPTPSAGVENPMRLAERFEYLRQHALEYDVNWSLHEATLRAARWLINFYAPWDAAPAICEDLTHLIQGHPNRVEDLDSLLSSTRDYLSGDVEDAMAAQETSQVIAGMSGVRPSGPPINRNRARRALDLDERRAPAEIDSGEPSGVGTLGTEPKELDAGVARLAARVDRLEHTLRAFAEAPINHDGGASLKRIIRREIGGP